MTSQEILLFFSVCVVTTGLLHVVEGLKISLSQVGVVAILIVYGWAAKRIVKEKP